MNKREFIRLSAFGAAAGVIAPSSVLAANENLKGAGGLFYTKDAPGRWSKKVGGHLPNIEVSKAASGTNIEVVTSHEMKWFGHYIIKHTVLNDKFEFITEHMFDPEKDKAAISQFDLGGYSGRIHVLSMCNVHDVWLNTADV